MSLTKKEEEETSVKRKQRQRGRIVASRNSYKIRCPRPESSSPPRSYGSFGGGGGNDVIRNDVYNRLIENRNEEAISNPDFRELLEAHFNRLPPRILLYYTGLKRYEAETFWCCSLMDFGVLVLFSYGLDINMDRAEDVLLHQKLLTRAKDPDNRPVFHIRFMENVGSRGDDLDGEQVLSVPPSHSHMELWGDFETCSKLEDLNLDVRKISDDINRETSAEDLSRRQETRRRQFMKLYFQLLTSQSFSVSSDYALHMFLVNFLKAAVVVLRAKWNSVNIVLPVELDNALSALLSDIGLNIREAHVFSTTDGYSLDVFVVDGWHTEDTEGLYDAMVKAIAGSEDVAIKVLRSEHLNNSLEVEFAQEVAVLRQVQHGNVVRFIGACTKLPHLCIVTEYMPGGSLYEYLHKHHLVLKLPQLLKFAIDVCKGMEYLHQKNVIHRDLKTANLLMDTYNVVKVADFGVARFQNNGGVMTAETGTYRWMAPEVINHQPYDQKADVFSFAIVLWELVTAKVPYDTMTPLQAALGVRQGLRPELPKNAHPKLLDLMQRCWEAVPSNRPSFSEIRIELEELLKKTLVAHLMAAEYITLEYALHILILTNVHALKLDVEAEGQEKRVKETSVPSLGIQIQKWSTCNDPIVGRPYLLYQEQNFTCKRIGMLDILG
ncbi:Serine/threonine-protein kinase STY46 [Sesamum angolense]|uniref:Serine/threonine-protein kinase STY46 n=1 Tax=Sesamum angolense TaxID=2727404 RepID=A0AAE1WCP7_9LAMI|nr:Serine/threonine-protein kinase STY46 [Sesamum angolense]